MDKHNRYSYPLIPWIRYKHVPDTRFLDNAYYYRRGVWHQGIDLNGAGGGNSDCGALVFNMYAGTVTAVLTGNGTGNIVKVRADEHIRAEAEHALSEYYGKPFRLEVLDMLYMHLKYTHLEYGDAISTGDAIGSMGDGTQGLKWHQRFNTRYYCHLHLEAIKMDYDGYLHQRADKKQVRRTHIDPMLLLKLLRHGDKHNQIPKMSGAIAQPRYVYVNDKAIQTGGSVKMSTLNGKIFLNTKGAFKNGKQTHNKHK